MSVKELKREHFAAGDDLTQEIIFHEGIPRTAISTIFI